MADNIKYCPGCMGILEEGVNVCPECFYNTETENNSPALKTGTILSTLPIRYLPLSIVPVLRAGELFSVSVL